MQLLAALALALASCSKAEPVQEGPSEASLEVRALLPSIESKLAMVPAIRSQKLPPTQTDGFAIVAFSPVVDTPGVNPNATVEYEADLADLSKVPEIPDRIKQAKNVLRGCQFLVDYAKANPSADLGDSRVAAIACSQLRYVFVLRIQEQREPKITGEKVENNRQFTAGLIRGDVLAFNIDDGKPLGGFRFAVTNRSQTQLLPAADLKNELEKNLEEGISRFARP